MNRLVLASVLVGCCLAMPQGQSVAPKENPFVKILEFESYQNGANYGHALQQEDGTATGQKVGPDGLVYGFYSYVQDDGNRVKVYYRAGQGVGYEVLKVEGINGEGLVNPQEVAPRQPAQVKQPTQNLHQTIRQSLPVQPQQQHSPLPIRQPVQQPIARQPVQQQVVRQPVQQQVVRQPVQQQVVRQPVQQQFVRQPVVQQQPLLPRVNPLVSQDPTPAPHRFDYPANLNLQRTGSGFRSSFKAI